MSDFSEGDSHHDAGIGVGDFDVEPRVCLKGAVLSFFGSFVYDAMQQRRIMTIAVETVRGVINLRLKVLVEFLRRLRRKSPAY